jgi:glycine oxidase
MSARSTAFAPVTPPLQTVVVAGAGIIGLSVALELTRRGIGVTVLERGRALTQASTAAAGMLASEDPHNPVALRAISQYSLGLYPEYRARLEALSGLSVPVQTTVAVQYLEDGSTVRLAEESLDPRQLATALLGAVRAAGIDLREGFSGAIPIELRGKTLVISAGAWASEAVESSSISVAPRKGQMLRVILPHALRELSEVHRSERIYIVPRTHGPQAGTALLGATVERAGFDTTTNAADLARLRAQAAELLPALASEMDAPMVEAWAGLRPGTTDDLPVLGYSDDATLWATGHYRNGILLAPATAMIVADLLEGKTPAVDLAAFAPGRFVS